MTNQCSSPPELEIRQLLAIMDGEADTQVIDHLRRCSYCRDRSNEIRKLHAVLTASLFRKDCPTPLELGDYQLGLLAPSRAEAITQHLKECTHCIHEIAQLDHYLVEFNLAAKTNPLKKVSILIARLVGEKGHDRHSAGFRMVPAYAALRGNAQGPVLLEANGILITLDIQRVGEGNANLLGQVAGDDQEQWTGASVELRQAGEVRCTATVDDLGAFHCLNLPSGPGELTIHPKTGPVVQANVDIVVEQ